MMPIGTEMIVAQPVMISVPKIACDRAAALADHAAHRLGEELPGRSGRRRFETTVQSSDTSGVTASANAQLIEHGHAAVGRLAAALDGPRPDVDARRRRGRRCRHEQRGVEADQQQDQRDDQRDAADARATARSAAGCRWRPTGAATGALLEDGRRDDRAVAGAVRGRRRGVAPLAAAWTAASPRAAVTGGSWRSSPIDHQIRIWRLMTARAAMLTTSVTANRTRPEAIRALTVDAGGLGEVERDVRRDRRRVRRS